MRVLSILPSKARETQVDIRRQQEKGVRSPMPWKLAQEENSFSRQKAPLGKENISQRQSELIMLEADDALPEDRTP